MVKKVAIVTWYANLNYGGTLQAYALQEVIRMFGYESEFVDFCPEKRSIVYRLIRLLKDITIFSYKPKLYCSRRKMQVFVRKFLNVSSPHYRYDDLCDKAEERYSAAVCGSDQIWSNIGGRINPLYYLTFIDRDKRISYAPSLGYNRVRADVANVFAAYVNDIRFLSVREKQGAEIIKEHTGRDAEVVLDPSLLLTEDQWVKRMAQTNKMPHNKNYIFCYLLGETPDYVEYICRLSKLVGCPIISVESKFLWLRGTETIIADPFEFLHLISGASYVITDSFHGTALSINFEKQFGVFRRFRDDDPISQNSRIYNILEKTHLESRLINLDTPLDFFLKNRIDYDLVRPILDEEREKSLAYLRSAMDSVHGA